MRSEPDLTRVPRQVRRVLESCLQKDPKKRLRDIGDVWKLLDDAPPRTEVHAAQVAVAAVDGRCGPADRAGRTGCHPVQPERRRRTR